MFVIVKKMHANTRICFNNADIGVHSFGFFAGEEDPREVVSSDQLGLTVVELRENDLFSGQNIFTGAKVTCSDCAPMSRAFIGAGHTVDVIMRG